MRFRVAGVTFENRQEIIEKYCYEGDIIHLFLDVNNPYDENAIMCVKIDEETGVHHMIGYVPRRVNALLAEKLRSGEQLQAYIFEIHGGDGLNIGVTIEVDVEFE